MLLATFLDIDPILTLYAVIAFNVIGVGLAGMILFTRAKFVSAEKCKLNINDDPALQKNVIGGGTLLITLTNQGIPVPSPCGGKATCKQCRVKIIEGAPEPLETDKATFTKKELDDGWRLSCQAKVKHDMSLEIDPHALSVKEWKGKVVSNENVATFIKELVVEVPEKINYKSGEYLQFHVPAFKTNTTDWKQTMETEYFSDWEKYKLFDQEVDFSTLFHGHKYL